MNTSLFPAASLLVRSLGWALFSSLWQGLLIFFVLSVALKFVKNTTAQVKYLLSSFSLVGLLVWFINSWINQWQHLQPITVYITQPVNDHIVTKAVSVTSIQPESSFAAYMHHLFPVMDKFFPALVTIYIAGLIFMLLRFAINIYSIQALRRQGIVAPDATLKNMLVNWQNKFGIARRVEFFFSTKVNVPVMLGNIKPVILLPFAAVSQLTIEQVEAILMHELAHIKRHDYLLNIFQTLIETVLFFNPFVWWMSAIIRREREHCCDDIVVKHTTHTLSYANALARLETYRLGNKPMALAATGNKNQLFNRIKRITEMKKPTVNYTQATIATLLIIAIIASVAVFSPSFAQKVNKKSSNSTVKTQQKKEEKYIVTDSNGNKTTYHTITEVPTGEQKQAKKEIKSTTITQIDDNADADNEDMTAASEDMKAAGAEMATAAKQMATMGIAEAANAMKNIDWAQISTAIAQAGDQINNVDWDQIDNQLQAAMTEIDNTITDPKVRKEMKIEIHKGMEEAKKEMTKARVEMAKNRQALRETRKKEIAEAHIETAKSREALVQNNISSAKSDHFQMSNVDDMIDEMSDDGLIDKSKDFNIEMNNKSLYIDGNIQPSEVFNKYQDYARGRNIVVNKKHGQYNILINSHNK